MLARTVGFLVLFASVTGCVGGSFAVGAGALGAAVPAPPAPKDRYAAFNMINETGTTIRYEVRWGKNDRWKRAALASGYNKTHYWTYDYPGQNRSPVPEVRFDFIAGDGQTDWKVYDIKAYAVQDWRHKHDTHRYHFGFDRRGVMLDLYSIN